MFTNLLSYSSQGYRKEKIIVNLSSHVVLLGGNRDLLSCFTFVTFGNLNVTFQSLCKLVSWLRFTHVGWKTIISACRVYVMTVGWKAHVEKPYIYSYNSRIIEKFVNTPHVVVYLLEDRAVNADTVNLLSVTSKSVFYILYNLIIQCS